MGNIFFFEWEVKLIEILQKTLPNAFLSFLKLITEFGDVIPAVVIVSFIYFCIDKKTGKKLSLVCCLSFMIFPLLKNLFFRLRPYMAHETIVCLKSVVEGDIYDTILQGYSFPSGHSAIAMSLFGFLFIHCKNRFIKIVCPFVIVLVAVSRFVLGVHYPTDVLAGLLIGMFAIGLVEFFDNKWGIEKLNMLLLLLGFIGIFYCVTDDFYIGLGSALGFTIGDMIERKWICFENTDKWSIKIRRLVIGLFILYGLKKGSGVMMDMLDISDIKLSHLLETFRYFILIVISFACYPAFFRRKNDKGK